MKFITENEAIREVAATIASWGRPNEHGVRAAGGTFEYYKTLNTRGQFLLSDGRRVVLEDAELTMALDLSRKAA